MRNSDAQRPTAPTSTVQQFVCAEVRGGNWPIDTAIATPGLRGWLCSQPSEGGRGGDVHYISVCGSGLLSRLCVADVAGHGETVSAITQRLQQQLRRHMNTLDQRRVFQKLNRQLVAEHFEAFATAALVTYYPPSQKASISYAGHPPAWLRRKSHGRWQAIQGTDAADIAQPATRPSRGPSHVPATAILSNLPLGVTADTTFSRINLSLSAGDCLLLLTDGILEAPGAGGQMFGEAALPAFLNEAASLSPDEFVPRAFDQVQRWTNGVRHDDLTMLAVEVVPGPPGPAAWTAVKNRLLRPIGLISK